MKKRSIALVSCAAVLAIAAAAGLSAARANGVACVAYAGGLETTKSAVPELVVYNTGGTPMSLTLTLRNDKGQTLATPATTVDVPGFNTVFTSLSARLATAGEGGKPYDGRFSLEVSGGAPFSEVNAVVHVTQYFGKRAKDLTRPVKPLAAFIVRPLFLTTP